MNNVNVKWAVIEEYYGKWNSKQAICFCEYLYDAAIIIDAMAQVNIGRPYIYRVEKCADDMYYRDDEICGDNFITGEKYDYSKYIEGVWA